jgi:GntR family transcriptional regulator/MocR family aminotransferase
MVKRAADVDGLPFDLQRGARATLPRQIADEFRAAIRCGRLPVGTRLPATRRLASSLGVSRNTTAAAYDDLLADGLIAGRVGAGTYVASGVHCIRLLDCDGNPLLVRSRCHPSESAP